MDEKTVQNQIRLALSERGVVFRTNAGDFWQGELRYSREFGQQVLVNLRRVSGLPKGFPDLVFVGPGKVAFIECKDKKGRTSKGQQNFARLMEEYGLPYGVAKSVEDAIRIIEKE